jgi:hypothetical protein
MSRNTASILAFALLAPICCCNNSSPPAGSGEVKLTVVKLPEYVKILEGLRGKIVVADIWGEF